MIKIAIVGTGGMANTHAENFGKIRGCKISAVCDVDKKRAEAFARRHGLKIPVFVDFSELLDRTDCDAVANVTSDAFHAPLSLEAIAAGKHVLCEKPLATCYADAKKMSDAARRKGVINMVNFSYRDFPVIHKARQLVHDGRIGKVMHIEASYLQSWLSSKVWGDWRTSEGWLWRLSTKHGSMGVLGDVGVHILDFATYPAGEVRKVHCLLKNFPKAPGNRIGKYRLDANDSAVITIEFAGRAVGTIHASRYATGYVNRLCLQIFGDEGALRIDLDKASDRLEICAGKDRHKVVWRTVRCAATPSIYRRFIKSIKTGENDQPDFARGAVIQKVIDACFQSDKADKTIKV